MVSKVLATLAASIFAANLGLAIHGCLNVKVIHVDESDAAADSGPIHDLDVSGDAPRPCEVCMRAPSDPGPGCAEVIAVCAADQPCNDTMECAIASRCLELNGQGAIIDCGTPCGRDAGLDLSSPSLTLVFAVVDCAQDKCGPICRGEVDPPSARRR